jgi:hypothetical protein
MRVCSINDLEWLVCLPDRAITGDIYGHTSDDAARAAVEGLAGQLGLLD